MKLSYNWLKDYLKCDLSPERIAEIMTSIGIEVDSVEYQEQIPGGLEGVVVAHVLECTAHPDSDHLHITKVDAGDGAEPLTVVCGAPNVAAGQKVLLAKIGTVLPGDFKIKKSKIRGVESFGMICAEDELGIGTSHDGIMVLPDSAVPGTPAREWLGLETEAVIEYEITANRVDAASHWGVARDLYAYLRLNNIPCELCLPDVDSAFHEGESGDELDVEVLTPDGAPRYCGITLRDVKVGPSPEWLQKRLMSIGLHPINNVVDISNFVLFEVGQPLHTFDADTMLGHKVVVRRAVQDEIMVTLDGVERKLNANDVVIADAEHPMCIGGVFGGAKSGVTDATVSVFVESAYFDPASIRKTSKTHGIQTDASFRNERGADPNIVPYALKRAVNLILECGGGRVCGRVKEIYPSPIEKKRISLDYSRIEAFVGHAIGHDTIESILRDLGYDFLEKTEGGAVVAAPTYMVDVYRECDVVEEILRIYGYNNIPLPRQMRMSVTPSPNPDPEKMRNMVSDFLAANGFVEIMNNSLTKGASYEGLKTWPAEKSVRIVNPLSQDLNVLRQSLIPGGLEVLAYNANRQTSYMKTFEYGSVYARNPEKDPTKLEGYEEHTCFCLLMSGTAEKSWRNEPAKSNYFQLKGYLELLFKRVGADLYQFPTEAAPEDIFSEGVCYMLPGSSRLLARMGTVNPAFARRFGVKQPVWAAEIEWNALFELIRRDKVAFRELPKFPAVHRDLALLLDESVSYAELRAAAFKQAKKLLRQVGLFDVYRGDKIPEGKKQYALSFVIRDDEKTLTDQDTERVMDRLLNCFREQFGAQLR